MKPVRSTELEPCQTCGSDAIATRSDCMDGDEFCLACDPPEDDESMYTPLSESAAAILGRTFSPEDLTRHLLLLDNVAWIEKWHTNPNMTPWVDQVMSPPRAERKPLPFPYEVGETVVYRAFGGVIRVVVVTAKDANIKNGRSGFDGVVVGTGEEVWGYDDQIVSAS